MTNKRRSSVKEQDKIGKLYGIHGRRLCRFCRKEVPENRKTFCSNECVHEWKLRSNVKYLRKFVYERDLGICSVCNLDTRYQKIEIENRRRESIRKFGNIKKDSLYLEFLKSQGITVYESEKTLWQADHVKPVILGGGECGLDNIRTVCIKCHKFLTKQLNSERRKCRKLQE